MSLINLSATARNALSVGKAGVPDPFLTYSSVDTPKDLTTVFQLCEYMWLAAGGNFKSAMQRVVRYFITDLEFSGLSDAEQKRYREFMIEHLNMRDFAGLVGDDLVGYGNSFVSLYFPIRRVVYCSVCKFSQALDNVADFKFDLRSKKFMVYCPRCKKSVQHTHKDFRCTDENLISLVRWNIHDMELSHNFITGTTTHTLNIPGDLKTGIATDPRTWVTNTPWELIEAATGSNRFTFDSDFVLHLKQETLCGVRNRGWGIPPALGAFKDIWSLQLLRRQNEAINQEYIVPMRLLSPASQGSIDPLLHYDSGDWAKRLQSIIAQHRRDPTSIHTVPFPVNYQAMSGEGLQLVPAQLIKQGQMDLMDALGIPIELFQGSLSIQSAPTAMRLFQAAWPHVVSSLNRLVLFIAQHMSKFFGWEDVKVSWKPTTYADDLERRGMLMQLNAAGQISKQTAWSNFGVDPKEEQRRTLEEQKAELEAQQEFEEDQAQKLEFSEMLASTAAQPMPGMPMDPSMMGGDPAAGGMPAGMPPPAAMGMPTAGRQGSVTPQRIIAEAESMAQQLLSMPESQRKTQMMDLKNSDPVLHAAVKQSMENMRTGAEGQGRDMMYQQLQGGGQ